MLIDNYLDSSDIENQDGAEAEWWIKLTAFFSARVQSLLNLIVIHRV